MGKYVPPLTPRMAQDLKGFAKTATQKDALEAIIKYGSGCLAAKEMGMSTGAINRVVSRVKSAAEAAGHDFQRSQEFQITPPTSPELPIERLIEIRKEQYKARSDYEETRKLLECKVKIPGPIGIHFFGDPHVDDDGTDIFALERDCEIIRATEGLYGANVGDTTNNWVGRLARLYAEQSTTASQAWQLAEWFLRMCMPEGTPASEIKKYWLFMIAGNHDMWSGAGDPIKWITKQSDTVYESSEVRINLVFPNGREVRVNARHDFKGHSQWNPAHGSMKAAQMGFRDHILINGHRHVSGYGCVKDPSNGVLSHCIQVASYKVYDRFAREKGFPDQHISPSVTAIIDPEAKSEKSLVHVIWDSEQAADYLTWLRSKQ